jgi:cytoskeleton protein RodZ
MTQDDIHLHAENNPVPAVARSAGSILAAQRLQAGLSLEDVAAKLKLAKRQIEALETDRYEALPGNTFVRGFVRNYARLLQIDAQPLLSYLAQHLPAEAPQAALPRLQDEAMPMLRPGGGSRPTFVRFAQLAVLFAVVLVGVAAWVFESGHHEPQLTVASPALERTTAAPSTTSPSIVQPAGPVSEVAPVVSDTPSGGGSSPSPGVAASGQIAQSPLSAVTESQPSVDSQPVATTPVASTPVASTGDANHSAAGGDVRVLAHQDSWVLVVDANGRRLVNEIVRAGESRAVSGKAPYQVRIGNGPHTDLVYKGKATDLTPFLKADVATLELK